jgi:hypothetical protein
MVVGKRTAAHDMNRKTAGPDDHVPDFHVFDALPFSL